MHKTQRPYLNGRLFLGKIAAGPLVAKFCLLTAASLLLMAGLTEKICMADEIEVDLSDYDWEDGIDDLDDLVDLDDLDDLDRLEDAPKLKINKKQLEVKLGKEKLLKVSGATKKVKWKSSNTKIAEVSKNGKVKGKKCGTVTVKATSGSQKATCKVTVYASKKYVETWREKAGRYYYYNKYGQQVTGRKDIGGKTYYFDGKGHQRTGWVKIGGSYYYFHQAKGKKGFLVKNKTVNHIKISSAGKAKITAANKARAYILARSNEIVFEKTDWTMSRGEALKKIYEGFATGKSIVYKNIGGFQKEGNWPERYAMVYLKNGYGDCYTTNCAFAYQAIALGYQEVYAMSAGWHGWCKIDGKYYDPRWAMWGTRHIYEGFAVPEELCGKGSRLSWNHALYTVKIE